MSVIASSLSPSPALPPVPPLMTAEEFFALHENDRAELVCGIVKETPMPDLQHGYICNQIGRHLGNFAEQHDLGRVMSNDSFVKVRRGPDSVRGADVCFISFNRLSKGQFPPGLLDVVPELIAEVRSPSEAWTELIAKVLDYLAAGVTAVAVFNPERKAVAVYRSDADERHLSGDDELTFPDMLPGFAVPVAKFFP